ncbi:MAG: MarC family protein [Gemmatimonadaceae bacterium]|nr:MarC family protein [Acetobacteraceae bacterium]
MLAAFLVALPALFSIVNPIAGAFIFRGATDDRTHAERAALARTVGLYSLIVMLVALWAGSYVLALFGISIAALRIAGGIVLSLFAWELLGAPEKREGRKQEQAADAGGPGDDVAFFPLTLPFTTGPGTIAVAVALGAGQPAFGAAWAAFYAGLGLAALAMAGLIWLTYAYADRLSDLLGRTGSKTVTRLSAFILFCIGVQMLITGVTDVLGPLFRSGA